MIATIIGTSVRRCGLAALLLLCALPFVLRAEWQTAPVIYRETIRQTIRYESYGGSNDSGYSSVPYNGCNGGQPAIQSYGSQGGGSNGYSGYGSQGGYQTAPSSQSYRAYGIGGLQVVRSGVGYTVSGTSYVPSGSSRQFIAYGSNATGYTTINGPPVTQRPLSYGGGQNWTWPGDLRSHMTQHGVNPSGASHQQLVQMHNHIHNQTRSGYPNRSDVYLLGY